MFKYLWLIVVLMFYIWWTVKAIQGIITGIRLIKQEHKRFDLDYCPEVTVWYIIVHAIVIFAWSVMEFIFSYS